MNSFTATIAFALLALWASLIVNLFGWMVTRSDLHLSGAVVAMAAIGAAYWAQHNFTLAEAYLIQHQRQTLPGYAGPEDPQVWDKYESTHQVGTVCQWVSVAFGALAVLLFFLGG